MADYAVGDSQSPTYYKSGLTQAQAVAYQKAKPYVYIWKRLPSGWQRVNVKTKTNPARRLPANRLTPVSFTVKGKRHTGKAKRVGNVVKVFVTPGVARKVNPELKEYKVILHRPGADRGVTAAVYATTAGGASREARKRKAEFVPSDPKKWKVFSVTRSTGTR
jgi:hypothetical protein